jgi:EAL domain-containing protein (putative c-di-GMP-specific phosphodiesterase class I)
LVASTIELGHNLGLTVTAEGVEDDATRAALVAAGCDLAQGYLFARPQPAHHISQFLHPTSIPNRKGTEAAAVLSPGPHNAEPAA